MPGARVKNSNYAIQANKDFDFIVMRRRWDYFVRNLMGATPPEGYVIKIEPDARDAVEKKKCNSYGDSALIYLALIAERRKMKDGFSV